MLTPAPFSYGQCMVDVRGPYIGVTHEVAAVPPPSGGVIPDATYDLTQILDLTGKAANDPPMRWSMRVQQGQIISAMDPAPPICGYGNFYIEGASVRFFNPHTRKTERWNYSVVRYGLMLISDSGMLIFQRR